MRRSVSAMRSAILGGLEEIWAAACPLVRSMNLISPSQLPETADLPSCRATTEETTSPWGWDSPSFLPSTDHRATLPSCPQVTSRPSGVKAAASTPPPCAVQLATRLPVFISQVETVPSAEQLASTLESARQARPVTDF